MRREEIDKLAIEARESAEAFGQLYDIFQPKIYAHSARWVGNLTDAEDITAHVFERALKGIRGFDPNKASFYTWLFKIMGNVIADHFRARGRVTEISLEVAEQLCDTGAESDIERVHGFMTLHRLMSELPWKHQEILILRYIEEMSDPEIAGVLECTRGYVVVKAFRALRALKKLAIKHGVLEELEEERSSE